MIGNDRELEYGSDSKIATDVLGGVAGARPSTYPSVEQLEEILWHDCDDDVRLYCIMDGFWADGLYGRLLNSPDISWTHLFQGDVATKRVQQAPFIIALQKGHRLTRWLLEKGWGQGWGVYFTVSNIKAKRHYGTPPIHDKRFLPSNSEDIKLGNLLGGREDVLWSIRRHFRQFSDVFLESSGKIVDFRYYDPWVSYSYLTTVSKSQYDVFTSILGCLFGAAHHVSRPREVFDAFCYRFDCPDYKISFLNGARENSYQINFLDKTDQTTDFPSSHLAIIPTSQTKSFSILWQEKTAYIFEEKFAGEFNMPGTHDRFLQAKAIIHDCLKNNIHARNIIYKLVEYYLINKTFIYDLSQLSSTMTVKEKEIFLERLLDQSMNANGVM